MTCKSLRTTERSSAGHSGGVSATRPGVRKHRAESFAAARSAAANFRRFFSVKIAVLFGFNGFAIAYF